MADADRFRLFPVTTPDDWNAYHRIRRTELFEARGRVGFYDADHPDEYLPANQPLLFTVDARAVGVCRLDRVDETLGGVRLVAISAEDRGRGHGRILMARVERRALSLGLHALEVNSAPEAVGFYARLGFEMIDAARENPLMRKALA